ncbi:MAG: polysaccharide deacetylase family protein [Bacteroidales bacterium]
MYFVKVPKIVRRLYGSLVWDITGSEQTIYLTFDDGPDPEVTPDVLSLLDAYRAKATFFCSGTMAARHSGILGDIRAAGHGIGNHAFDHLNGWKTPDIEYIRNIGKANEVLKTSLFRPPYGKITRKQISLLRATYQIIMWSLMPGDFDPAVPGEKVVRRAIMHTKNGTIIVFHDRAQFREKMLFALEIYLKHFTEKGFSFKSIERTII